MPLNRQARFFIVVPVVFLALITVRFWQLPWTPVRALGFALFLFGMTMLTIARVNLGNSFSITPQARTLVRTGVYRWVRHPVYVFSAIGLAGLFLFINRPALLAILLLIIPLQIFRARAEERVLQERFGEEYRAYRKSTLL